MSIELTTLLLVASMIVVMFSGIPVAFGLGAVAMLFSLILVGPNTAVMAVYSAYSSMFSFLLVALPLFIFMGSVLEKSGLADALYETAYRWVGHVRGGLAIGTILICTLMAAMVGLVGPGILTMGVIALPSMLKRNYSERLAIGSILGGGSLGALIPPSVGMIMYAGLTDVSVGRLFIGGIVPGLVFAVMMIGYVAVVCAIRPELGPAAPPEERSTWSEKLASLKSVVLPLLLVVAVLGSIFAGITTPTEAAAVGALGALVCAAIYRNLSWRLVKESSEFTMKLFGMAMWIMIGASSLTKVYASLGSQHIVDGIVQNLPVSPIAIVIMLQLSLFVFGMFMEDYAIIMIAAPLYAGIVAGLGIDPVWFAVLFIANLQLAVKTPPFGFALFFMKAVAPPHISMQTIWRSAVPFVTIKAAGIALFIAFPQIVLWLPNLLMK